MNWEAIGALGEIVGAAAVVVSIVYLSVQIKSNTRAMKASAGFDATHSWATTNEQVMLFPDEMLVSIPRVLDPDESLENFSAAEQTRIRLMFRSLFQKLEGQYQLWKYGHLEPDIWQARRTWARGAIDTPVVRAWWEVERTRSVFTDEFIHAIESAKPIRISRSRSPPVDDA